MSSVSSNSCIGDSGADASADGTASYVFYERAALRTAVLSVCCYLSTWRRGMHYNLLRICMEDPGFISNREEAREHYGPMRSWDVSRVTNFCGLFEFLEDFNPQLGKDDDISGWNVSAGVDFSHMFQHCHLFNLPLFWNTSNATHMMYMFAECREFNQALDWNVGNVVSTKRMFQHCWNFNMPLTWNTRSLTCMCKMFKCCFLFNARLNFDTSRVICMRSMFSACNVFNQRIDFDMHLADCAKMFEDCIAYTNGSVKPAFTTSLKFPCPVKETLFMCNYEEGEFIPAAAQLTKQLTVNYRRAQTLGYGENEAYSPDLPWKEDDSMYAKRLVTRTLDWHARKKLKIALY